jgi:hypothetical protein
VTSEPIHPIDPRRSTVGPVDAMEHLILTPAEREEERKRREQARERRRRREQEASRRPSGGGRLDVRG